VHAELSDQWRAWQRYLLMGTLVASAALFWHPAVEPFMLVKATLIQIAAVLLGAMSLRLALYSGRLTVPGRVLAGILTAFVLGLAVATVTSTTPGIAVVGRYGRYTGLLSYLGYVLLFLLTVRLFTGRSSRPVALVLLGTLLPVTGYGLLQLAGADPFTWSADGLGGPASTLANVDFASAYVGSLVPLIVWVVLCAGLRVSWRIAAGFLGVVPVLYVWLTGAAQGPAVALGGVLFLLAVCAADRRQGRTLGQARTRVLLVAAAVLAVLGGGVFGDRLVHVVQGELAQSFVERASFYRAAWDVFAAHPVAGGGLDGFANHFTLVRPAAHALLTGRAGTDSVHSVPLQMFTDGGLLLGLPYVAFVVFVFLRLVQGLRSLEGERRQLLAAFGGVWLAYQAQAAISIDVPPLALLNWIVGGVIVALAGRSDLREVPVRRRRSQPGAATGATVSGAVKGGAVLIVVLALVSCWLVTRPLRADLSAAAAAPLGRTGQLDAAITQFDHAIALAPWEPSYRFYRSKALYAAHRDTEALAGAEDAARQDPGNAQYCLYAAEMAAALPGHTREALYWYGEAVRRDPRDPHILLPAAQFTLDHGRAGEALGLARRAVALRPDVNALLILAQAQAAAGDTSAAVESYRRVLTQSPANGPATDALKQLSQPAG
jgi:tetratricopeptide (TPR) repeat protein